MMLEFGMRNGDILRLRRENFAELSRQMRVLGFTGAMGAYGLRKICIDHVDQKLGADYAAPSQPNVGEFRIVNLL